MNPVNNMLAASDLKPVQEMLCTSIVLNRANMPYRVLTDATTDFGGLKTIIVNDASFMSAEEAERLRQFVHAGGTLIATGMTSHADLDGRSAGDFALKDVFGVAFTGKFSKHWNYLGAQSGELISNDVPAPLVTETTANVLARVVEPMFDRDDLEHFASYHSNPPGKPSPYAAMTVNQFGRGTCVYLYSSLLAKQQEAQQAFGESLLRRFAPSSIIIASDAPPCVEITLLRSPHRPAYLLCFVNFQEEPRNLPVHGVSVTLRPPCGGRPRACRSVSTGHDVPFEREDDRLTFRVPRLDTMEMIELEMEAAPWLGS